MEIQEFVKTRNPMEYLKIFFRRKWLFLSPIFIGLVLGIVTAFLMPPTFESSTLIMVQEEKTLNPLMQGLAVSSTVAQRMNTLKDQILGWNSMVELAKKLDLIKNSPSQASLENLIAGLKKDIDVSMPGTNLIKISCYGKDPVTTQQIAKNLTTILIERNIRSQTKETEVAIDFIQNQLKVYKRKIKGSEVASLEEQLNNLLIDSTEEHPLVKELRLRIAAAKKDLGPGEDTIYSTDKPITSPVYQKLQQELDKLIQEQTTATSSNVSYASSATTTNTDPQDPSSSIYKLMLMDKLDSVLARDIQINENIYNMLLQKLETAKITQRLEASKEGTRYDIIEPPRLPLKPSKPNKLLVVFLGLFLGTCSGAGLVLGKEFMDHSFMDVEDAKNNLGLPVLGAISRITTQEEIEKEKEQQKKIVTVALIAGGALILLSFVIYILR
jgi:polysaccharide biosynthesis transport protein